MIKENKNITFICLLISGALGYYLINIDNNNWIVTNNYLWIAKQITILPILGCLLYNSVKQRKNNKNKKDVMIEISGYLLYIVLMILYTID